MELEVENIPQAYNSILWRIKTEGVREDSRNGPVITLLEPLLLTVNTPEERVLTNETRNANPFFHVMEFVWMMSGSNDIKWISQFNKRMMEYSDDGITQHAAYGHRWRRHFGIDQIIMARNEMDADRNSRRVVLGMWDPRADFGRAGKDLPCNTQIYLRTIDDRLCFTVCNRSNDVVWGMLGANAVHMTMLHELLAKSLGLYTGGYHVMTNNAHFYPGNYDIDKLVIDEDRDIYRREEALTFPLLQEDEDLESFLIDCENLRAGSYIFHTEWMQAVGFPIFRAWFDRSKVKEIEADDWRIACQEWVERAESRRLERAQGSLDITL